MKTETTKAIERIGSGLTGVFFKDYIGSAAPRGWTLDDHVLVIPALRAEDAGKIVVHVKAWSPLGRPVGAKLVVDPTIDLQELAAMLSTELWNNCASSAVHADVPIAELRFSLAEGATAPARGSDGASGYDLYAMARAVLNPGQIFVIDTGVILELPRGYEGQVRPRSGMTKRGVWVALGTIDSDYRGTIGATVINHARETQVIEAGDRIAQLVISEVVHRPWVLVERDDLSITDRGTRGWGSTGR